MTLRPAWAATIAASTVIAASVAQAETPAAQTSAPAPYQDHRTGEYFQTGGDRIFYQKAGHGPAMLLIHGFPLSGALFERQLVALSQSYTVIAPDLPGFGKSTTGTTLQTEEHYAQDLFALLDSLGVGQAIIGGHSMGGQVTLEMYREHSSRFRGMILFDTNPAPASIVEQAQWPAYGLQAKKLGSASIAPAVVGVMVTGSSLVAYPDLGTEIAGFVSEAMPDGVLGGGIALTTRRDYRPLLGAIGVPTLVIEGRDDPVYPVPISQALNAAIPGSTLSIIPAVAHASMFQWPGYANSVIRTWAKGAGLGAP